MAAFKIANCRGELGSGHRISEHRVEEAKARRVVCENLMKREGSRKTLQSKLGKQKRIAARPLAKNGKGF
jgi:hypothetical protein